MSTPWPSYDPPQLTVEVPDLIQRNGQQSYRCIVNGVECQVYIGQEGCGWIDTPSGQQVVANDGREFVRGHAK